MTNALNTIADFITAHKMAEVTAKIMSPRRASNTQKKALAAIATMQENGFDKASFRELVNTLHKFVEAYHASFIRSAMDTTTRITNHEDDKFDYVGKAKLCLPRFSVYGVADIPKEIEQVREASEKATTPTLFDDVIKASEEMYKVWKPVVEAINELTPGTTKKAPKPTSPGQVRGTCPVCFGNYAVTRKGKGYIAMHGFRKFLGRTAPCPGSHYTAFEESSSGTEAHVRRLKEALKEKGDTFDPSKVSAYERTIESLQEKIDSWEAVELKCSPS